VVTEWKAKASNALTGQNCGWLLGNWTLERMHEFARALNAASQRSAAIAAQAVLLPNTVPWTFWGNNSIGCMQAISQGTTKKWIKDIGKALDCKGKRLFMPVRIALTGQMAGPDVGQLLELLAKEDNVCKVDGYVKLPERMETLRASMA
jgi:glutamyl/glutaminyl-tRNA synthetase